MVIVVRRVRSTHLSPIRYICDVDLAVLNNPDERVDAVSHRRKRISADRNRRDDQKYSRIISFPPESTNSGMVTPELPDGDLEMFSLFEAAEDLRSMREGERESLQSADLNDEEFTAGMIITDEAQLNLWKVACVDDVRR